MKTKTKQAQARVRTSRDADKIGVIAVLFAVAWARFSSYLDQLEQDHAGITDLVAEILRDGARRIAREHPTLKAKVNRVTAEFASAQYELRVVTGDMVYGAITKAPAASPEP
jgi:hypothetical protein